MAQRLIEEYLTLAGHAPDTSGPVFRPVTNNRTKELQKPLNPNSLYRSIVLKYRLETGVSAEVNGLCLHSLRATAAANALLHGGGHRQGAGTARPRQRFHHAAIRSPESAPGGQPDVSGEVLAVRAAEAGTLTTDVAGSGRQPWLDGTNPLYGGEPQATKTPVKRPF
jgi:hypothetical protein